MTRTCALIGSVFIILAFGGAKAQDTVTDGYGTAGASYSETYGTCMDLSGGVTSAMLECSERELSKQDALLNEAYQHAMSRLDPRQTELLREAQRAWIKYRDTTCSLMRDLGDRGTMALLVDSGCILKETADRARWLNALDEY